MGLAALPLVITTLHAQATNIKIRENKQEPQQLKTQE